MKRPIALLVLLGSLVPLSAAHALTLHLDMTPELVGENGFEMEPLGNGRTRFTIRWATKDDPKAKDARFHLSAVRDLRSAATRGW